MISLESLSSRLRSAGFRMTKVRLAILQFMLDRHCALSAQDILKLLKEKGLKPNISTVYREVQFLVDQKIAEEIILKDGVVRYELHEDSHHHHLICNSCRSIESVEVEPQISSVEQTIQQEKRFHIQSHSLEFYGLCAQCH